MLTGSCPEGPFVLVPNLHLPPVRDIMPRRAIISAHELTSLLAYFWTKFPLHRPVASRQARLVLTAHLQ